jgi:hypothetical protein
MREIASTHARQVMQGRRVGFGTSIVGAGLTIPLIVAISQAITS